MTREEAIKILMGYSYTPEERTALGTLLPEFRMSEDERIRKELKEAFEAYDIESSWNGIPIRSIFAWLEKQKEQKPSVVEKLREISTPADENWFEIQKQWEKEDEQKEQKPISNPKWAELTWKDINELERIINNVHYEFQNGIGEDSFGELVLERFKEYKDDGSMDEQKPADLTKMMVHKEPYLAPVPIPMVADEQKPTSISCGHENDAEWGQEDKEKIVTISEIIEHCTTIPYSGGTLTLNKEYKKELLCFIKSLRPQYHGDVTMTEAYKMGLEAGKVSSWKPSEEQIEALAMAVTFFKTKWTGAKVKEQLALESLYEDLKKL